MSEDVIPPVPLRTQATEPPPPSPLLFGPSAAPSRSSQPDCKLPPHCVADPHWMLPGLRANTTWGRDRPLYGGRNHSWVEWLVRMTSPMLRAVRDQGCCVGKVHLFLTPPCTSPPRALAGERAAGAGCRHAGAIQQLRVVLLPSVHPAVSEIISPAGRNRMPPLAGEREVVSCLANSPPTECRLPRVGHISVKKGHRTAHPPRLSPAAPSGASVSTLCRRQRNPARGCDWPERDRSVVWQSCVPVL